MAIAEMRKLNLAAMGYERDKILNALQRTGAVEIKTHSELENAQSPDIDCEQLTDYIEKTEGALEFLSAQVESYEKANKIKSDLLKDGFDITYAEFTSACEMRAEIDQTVARITALAEKKAELGADVTKCEHKLKTAEIYSAVDLPLNYFSDTAHTRTKLGTVALTEYEKLINSLPELSFCTELNRDGDFVLVCVTAHISEQTDNLLSEVSFSPCPFKGDKSGAQVYNSAQTERENLKKLSDDWEQEIYSLKDKIRPLKIYLEYLSFELEKREASNKFLATERTFFMEAYVPAASEQSVIAELESVTSALYYEFGEPDKDEVPPTLMQNNKVVKNFEAITNMYSPPNSREFDPSTVMAAFYSLFMGFIIADAGYGLLMVLSGGFIWFKQKRESGLKSLAGVFAVGGIFAIIWGFLFNSLFGFTLPYAPVMPDAQTDMWSLAGIKVPAVFVISLLIGCAQLLAGYICKLIQCWRVGDIIGGLCDGLTWAVFSVGVALAIVGFIDEANISILAVMGGIFAACGLGVAVLTAGRKEKLLGKFTKGFGAAYGVINYASDILSYARLYGLMLSGAVIARIISQYSADFILGGNPAFIILGVVLLLVGHAFNLAMNLLGAYIHDARLQYVEFYGRFYEGEGELFTPLGSRRKYVYITNLK